MRVQEIIDASGVDPERLRFPQAPENGVAGTAPITGTAAGAGDPARPVMYWMQKAQRAHDNPALDFAAAAANLRGRPLVVLFVLTDYPSANPNHYRFMLEGLRETALDLRARGIGFRLRRGPMEETILRELSGASLAVCDEGRLRHELAWRNRLAAEMAGRIPVCIIETEAVVPPRIASEKEEYAAVTIRPRISAHLPRFLSEVTGARSGANREEAMRVPCDAATEASEDLHFTAYDAPAQAEYPHDRIGYQRLAFTPGHRAGMARFARFVRSGQLDGYDSLRNDPNAEGQSGLSPYLHFGQISPVPLARAALRHGGPSAQAFVEQLVVRRELAANFVLRNPGYDRYESAVPDWARTSLAAETRHDAYGEAVLESGETDDPYWNAAQREMVLTGKMHNYLRMYWGKRLLAWHADPKRAFDLAIRLNDRYSLDGRDPNGYTGVAWCFGRHDRPWPHQPFFNTVRAMVPAGLKRKFDVKAYAARMESLYSRVRKEM